MASAPYLVSACLAGEPCRYDGRANTDPRVAALVRQGRAVPVCPEVLGGLSVPREPCEIVRSDGLSPERRVLSRSGKDCTTAFQDGATISCAQGEAHGCTRAILKARSPSCGVGTIYDGTFSRTLLPGDGIFAAALRNRGYILYTEETFSEDPEPALPGDSKQSAPGVDQAGSKGNMRCFSGKTGIVLVAYGAGNPQSASTLKKVQVTIERHTGLPVRWAYTSEAIRHRLAHARTKTDSVFKALMRLNFERYTHVAVQSLHLIPGVEYEGVLEDVARVRRETGLIIKEGLPLLGQLAEDKDEAAPLEAVVDALFAHLPPERSPADAVVCMAHGSLHHSATLYARLAQAVMRRDSLVHVACMKGDRGLDALLPVLAAQKPERVWLLPLLSVAGKHSRVDMAGEKPTSWKSRLEAAGFSCRPWIHGLAEGQAFVGLWQARLDNALDALASESVQHRMNPLPKQDTPPD